MSRCLQDAQVPNWITKGKTTLITKDPNKVTAPNNYRPITCFPEMWKILTAQIREEIYYSLTSRDFFPEEQKGCRKESRDMAELLNIDQHILNESKTRRKNLSMAWIDNTKAYDMHNPATVLENDTLIWDFDIHTDHLISTRKHDLIIITKKKRTCKIVDFSVPADHRIKLKECEKKDKYLDLASELKKLWNMQVTIVPNVIAGFGTITEGLLKGLGDMEVGGRVETIKMTALLRTARILRRVLVT